MTTLNVTLKRSPRSLIVGDHTIAIEFARPEGEANTPADGVQTHSSSLKQVDSPSNARQTSSMTRSADAGRVSSGIPTATTPTGMTASPAMPKSTASITADPSGKVVTPLSQSNAVPILSGATHEVVTAADLGFGGVSEEELHDVKQLLANAAEMVLELQEQHRQSLSEMQEVAVELAAAAASWLVGFAIEHDMFAIDDLIRKSLHQLELDQPVRVRLNPADHELLRNLMKDPTSRDALKNVTCFDDSAIPRGNCRVESGRKILLTDMDSRLADIRRSWMEKLDDSQVERRGDGSAASALRRFPDRRETA